MRHTYRHRHKIRDRREERERVRRLGRSKKREEQKKKRRRRRDRKSSYSPRGPKTSLSLERKRSEKEIFSTLYIDLWKKNRKPKQTEKKSNERIIEWEKKRNTEEISRFTRPNVWTVQKSGYFCTKVYIFKNKSVYFQKQKGTKNYKSVQKCTKTYMNA